MQKCLEIPHCGNTEEIPVSWRNGMQLFCFPPKTRLLCSDFLAVTDSLIHLFAEKHLIYPFLGFLR